MGELAKIHGADDAKLMKSELASLLVQVYGKEKGQANYEWLETRITAFLDSLSPERLEKQQAFDADRPYDSLAGRVFAICYPDNVYDDTHYTLDTLGEVLKTRFPAVGGIHILPERPMSHGDVWPQDLFDLTTPEKAVSAIGGLKKAGYLDARGQVAGLFEENPAGLDEFGLPGLKEKLAGAYNSHFNDGGFSQKTRDIVDPRFGSARQIEALCNDYAVMLDYVVNHLDTDSDALESYRRGEGTGDAFIIICPGDYHKYKKDGALARTFRPRPFPLFTGLRKYPGGKPRSFDEAADLMGNAFADAGLTRVDGPALGALSLWFKLANDQGLTAEDKRLFARFAEWAEDKGIPLEDFTRDSALQSGQKVLIGDAADRLEAFASALGLTEKHGKVFAAEENRIFGEVFYVYTTFSESQADLNPLSDEGFRMIFDDMFSLMGDGDLAMMRMDAIKYLWKEIGEKNFDMDEGNRLIDVIRLVLRMSSPRIRALDEVNSPDPVVYSMGKEGGFYYLFGQVNSVAVAFNNRSLAPLEHLYEMMKNQCAKNLVLFVMLSTHDGRSVQGLGVDRTDGHVSIADFYELEAIIRDRGGKPKYRSVPKGSLPADTFDKICGELGWEDFKESLAELYTREGDQMVLKEEQTKESLLTAIAARTATSPDTLIQLPPVDFWVNWTIEGTTPYELCATSRSAFTMEGVGHAAQEARRLALAQLYVMTMGQVVPAVYMNDLLGLENDIESYGLSGRPRDLNRHKSHVGELEFDKDPFQSVYVPLMNNMIAVRRDDGAFYPGDGNFEFHTPGETVFLNHAYAGGDHSLILGNISPDKAEILLPVEELAGVAPGSLARLQDRLAGQVYTLSGGELHLVLEGYQALWLKRPREGQ